VESLITQNFLISHSVNEFVIFILQQRFCAIQCFDAVGWGAGRASGLLKKLSGGVLAWLSV